jgi:hypothetical protein
MNTCGRCSRLNPPEAQYCYFDGAVLGAQLQIKGPLNMGVRPFSRPFVFPSGRQCNNFDQLALACQDDGLAAMKLIQSGDLPHFLSAIGRSDLAQAARDIFKAPNKAIGFDAFLAALPSTVLQAPLLVVEPREVNLGDLQVGQDRAITLRLVNRGMRLVHGNMYCEDAPWLSIGDGGVKEKLIQFSAEQVVQLVVGGDRLSAALKPVDGKVQFRSSGGDVTVSIRANIPVRPFPAGVLQGCISPRQVAEKAKSHPHEAALFFESGAVEGWYKANGWNYPVIGPSSSGLGAIQQFFEALGLAKAPRVELSTAHVSLHGQPGATLRHLIEVRTQERRNVFAIAHSNQPWLKALCEEPRGAAAPIRLEIAEVPDCPGEALQARVLIHSNGNQRFELPVELVIAGIVRARPLPDSSPALPALPSASDGVSQAVFPRSATTSTELPPPRSPANHALPRPPASAASAVIAPVSVRPAPSSVDEDGEATEKGKSRLLTHLAPLALLLAVLMCLFPLHDVFFIKPAPVTEKKDEEVIDPDPLIAIKMHDQLGKDLATDQKEVFTSPTERFGLVMTKETDPTGKTPNKRLTYDQNGRSNNAIIRLDGSGRDHEFYFGDPGFPGEPQGKWVEPLTKLDKSPERERLNGYRSVWAYLDDRIRVTQTVELLAGGAAPGKNTRFYDTCLVTYKIENKDKVAHKVGLRFMLDTFIGSNDGVPFTLPGSNELCDTSRDFDSASRMPDFIEARERDDLLKPGTIAHLQLRLGSRYEAPERVTLGAWPDANLKDRRCRSQFTMWDVPVLPIRAMQALDPSFPPDSCVVMYWPEKELAPGKSRELAFAYGLGSLASDKEGKLGLTAPASAVKGEEFTVTALVKRPAPGQKVTLKLPDGLELSGPDREQPVPPLPENSTKTDSPVTWKVRARKSGSFEIEVTTSTGGSVYKKIKIKDRDIFN